MTMHFRDMLTERQEKLGSALCVGIDPDPRYWGAVYLDNSYSTTDNVFDWGRWIIDTTAPHATAFKFQMACFEAMHQGGEVLYLLLKHCQNNHPEIVTILDGKRGDIDRTQEKYRQAMFERYQASATTVNPYMGKPAVANMWHETYPNRGIISLVYNSNPEAREMQDIMTDKGMPYWLYVAECILSWTLEEQIANVGFVMSGAHEKDGQICSDHLRRCRELDQGSVFYLMLGFGAQGASVPESVAAGWAGWGSILCSASSSICNADNPAESAKALSNTIGEAIAAV